MAYPSCQHFQKSLSHAFMMGNGHELWLEFWQQGRRIFSTLIQKNFQITKIILAFDSRRPCYFQLKD